MIDLEESIKYFIEEIKSENKKIIENEKINNQENSKKSYERIYHFSNAISSLRNEIGKTANRPISWDELRLKKGKPVFVVEKNPFGKSSFSWWDIVDEVTNKYIKTSYSDEMYKELKGEKWDVFEFEIKIN